MDAERKNRMDAGRVPARSVGQPRRGRSPEAHALNGMRRRARVRQGCRTDGPHGCRPFHRFEARRAAAVPGRVGGQPPKAGVPFDRLPRRATGGHGRPPCLVRPKAGTKQLFNLDTKTGTRTRFLGTSRASRESPACQGRSSARIRCAEAHPMDFRSTRGPRATAALPAWNSPDRHSPAPARSRGRSNPARLRTRG